jgi:ATP-grasp domain, R2K clade family 2
MLIIQGSYDRAGVIHPAVFDSACALYGANDIGRKYVLYTTEDLLEGRLDAMLRIPGSCAVGTVEFMQEVWKKMGVNPDVPMNSTASGERMTMLDARKIVESGGSIFVKPVVPKAYGMSGTLMSPEWPNCNANVPDSAELFAYVPFHKPIVSEWRCYVYDRQIVHVANYSGDIFQTPDWEVAKSAVKSAGDEFPIAYTVDVAVLSDGVFDDADTVVVEFNDFWAIGNYGIDNRTYLRMLMARYNDIVTKKHCWNVTKK